MKLFCKHQYEIIELIYNVNRDSSLQDLGIEKFIRPKDIYSSSGTYHRVCHQYKFKTYTHIKLINDKIYPEVYELTILIRECIKCHKRKDVDVIEAHKYYESKKLFDEAMKEL